MLGLRLALLIKLGLSEEQSPACCVFLNHLVSWACFDTDLANLGTWEQLRTSLMNHSHKRCHKRGWAWESKGLDFVFVYVGVCFHHSLLSSESSFVLLVSVLQHVFNSACFTLALEPILKPHFGVWLSLCCLHTNRRHVKRKNAPQLWQKSTSCSSSCKLSSNLPVCLLLA